MTPVIVNNPTALTNLREPTADWWRQSFCTSCQASSLREHPHKHTYFSLYLHSYLDASSWKCLAKGENDKGSIFSQKSPTNHPHARSLSLFSSSSLDSVLLFFLSFLFSLNLKSTMNCRCIPQFCVPRYRLSTLGEKHSWSGPGRCGEQREVKGNGNLCQLVRVKLGNEWEVGEFLRELHSLSTSG